MFYFFICDPAFSACTAICPSASCRCTGCYSCYESIFSSFQTCWFLLPVIHVWPASVSCLPLPNFLCYHLLFAEHQSLVLLVQPVISAWLVKGMWEETLECYMGPIKVFWRTHLFSLFSRHLHISWRHLKLCRSLYRVNLWLYCRSWTPLSTPHCGTGLCCCK